MTVAPFFRSGGLTQSDLNTRHILQSYIAYELNCVYFSSNCIKETSHQLLVREGISIRTGQALIVFPLALFVSMLLKQVVVCETTIVVLILLTKIFY